MLDAGNVGIAGHSLGASAVSIVQQCSDESTAGRSCLERGGRSFSIRAVVGWDRLSAGGDIVPVVPGMDQQADGYFITPQPTPRSPDPAAHLRTRNAYEAPASTYAITIRGGTTASGAGSR